MKANTRVERERERKLEGRGIFIFVQKILYFQNQRSHEALMYSMLLAAMEKPCCVMVKSQKGSRTLWMGQLNTRNKNPING
jgi:hypothetical protein